MNYGNGGVSTKTANYTDCCAKCASTADCAAWDWNTETGQCWTKTNSAGKKHQKHRFSGVINAGPPTPTPGDEVPPQATASFDDAAWGLINAPHDMLINQEYDPAANQKQAYIPRGIGWYRKHFLVPSEWKGDAIWIYIEGAFHHTTCWLNGVPIAPPRGAINNTHIAGYTSFWLRLDTVSGVQYGGKNVIALHVDASSGTGWWYEGGGLMRHNYLVRAPPLHVTPDSAWAHVDVPNLSKDLTLTLTLTPNLSKDKRSARNATFHVSATVANSGDTTATAQVTVSIVDKAGSKVATGRQNNVKVSASADATVTVSVPVAEVDLWSVRAPTLYTVTVDVASGDALPDQVSFSTGARDVHFDANKGLFLNGEAVKMRGFCDHSNLGGVGGAVPDRVNLYRTQMLRTVGANAWRMAHNPPVPSRLDFMDRLGM